MEKDHESSQLDNLFLTVREELISHEHKKPHKKKHHHKKHNKEKSLLQLDSDMHMLSRGKSRDDSSDLTIDESADLELKEIAHTAIKDVGHPAQKSSEHEIDGTTIKVKDLSEAEMGSETEQAASTPQPPAPQE